MSSVQITNVGKQLQKKNPKVGAEYDEHRITLVFVINDAVRARAERRFNKILSTYSMVFINFIN